MIDLDEIHGCALLRVAILLATLAMLPIVCFGQSNDSEIERQLVAAAIERTHHQVRYDGTYRIIDYPNGDVPGTLGVCTDLVIRSYRKIGIDLQQLVHEDMRRNFALYPQHWGLQHPDSNIDHRRVPNLQVFFRRHGETLPRDLNPLSYQPGDIVTWMLPGNLPHIGIVISEFAKNSTHRLVAHNIGRGPQIEDMLFDHAITGHYRYDGLH